MTNLMESIINYYLEQIIEEHGVTEKEATDLLEDVLQDMDIENEILERIGTIS